MASFEISSLPGIFPNLGQDEAVKSVIAEGYHVAVEYTNKYAESDEPTNIGFARLPTELLGYLAQRNPRVLYCTAHGRTMLEGLGLPNLMPVQEDGNPGNDGGS